MTDIRIHRDHELGLERACAVADDWVVDARSRFGLECQVADGPGSRTIDFRRSGVSGRVTVTATAFDLHVKLGFLLAGFSQSIEQQVRSQLDRALAPPPR